MHWEPPEILSMQAVDCDRWDRRDHQRAIKGMGRYSRVRARLGKVARTGPDALVDVFLILYKAKPRLLGPAQVQPGHLVNLRVAEEILGLGATRRLRMHTVGDRVGAALECVTMAPLLEAIFEQLAHERDLAEKIQVLYVEWAQLAAQREALEREFDEAVANEALDAAMALAEALREARQQDIDRQARIDDAFAELMARLGMGSAELRNALARALEGRADRADEDVATARAWGLSPSELRRLSAKERIHLAGKLNEHRMREIADLFGRIRHLSLCDTSSVADGLQDEIVDLELGGDLGRVVPSELLLLGDPDTELDFLARWAERELLQYSVQGIDQLGRGGIVMCLDSSGSMTGGREMWSKAVMLNLLHTAREQRRQMHVIHFGSPSRVKIDSFVEPQDFTPDRIIEAAGTFWGGGTDFHTPMQRALQILVEEHERTGVTRADVVFATDDECQVAPEFMETYLAEMRRIGARTFGLNMSDVRTAPDGALAVMSEGRVASLQDLRSGRDVQAMLRTPAMRR